MPQILIPDWSSAQERAFRRSPMTFAHRLRDTGLVEDEALAKLLDDYPAELYDINLFDFDNDGRMTLRTGARGRLPGDEVLEGVKQGRMWLQLRSVHEHHPALGRAVIQAYDELARYNPSFRPVQMTGQLILSAPQAKVPFHVDAPGVILFHLRGRKRLWIYPSDEAHMPQRAMEDIMLKQASEDLPYSRAMDAAAQVVELEEGFAATWPLHAPHRVENVEGFNVSLSTDYQTWGSRLTNGAHYANGVFRRWGLPIAAMEKTPIAARAGLWAVGSMLRRAGVVEGRIHAFERSFELGVEA